MFGVCQQIAAIPTKRTPAPATQFLERDEIAALFARLPSSGRRAARDRALLLFLYNTGARVQEAADLRVEHLDFDRGPRARLHGKGGKWRTCPLWDETARLLRQLVGESPSPQGPVFCSSPGKALTRFGIYKLVRRHTAHLQDERSAARRIGPHVFRHTTAVHLLEAGVEVNVIRGWLGHVNLATTNRYADINLRTKEAALRQCAPPPGLGGPKARAPAWRNDEAMLAWLASL
jgi:site-specific recombinase XerD